MIRHWNAWDEGKKSHLFVADANTGAARDLTPKLEVNTPPAPFGGSTDYAWSPDGKELAFTAEPVKDLAWSTNTDIWTVPADGGELKNLTASNLAADAQPAYSPDGTMLAYVSQARPGFESDLWVLRARKRDGSETIDVSSYLDRPVQSYAWRNASSLAAVIDSEGTEPIVTFRLLEPSENSRSDDRAAGLRRGQQLALDRSRSEDHGLRPSHRRQARRDLSLGRGQAQAPCPDIPQRRASSPSSTCPRPRASRSRAPTTSRSTAGCSGLPGSTPRRPTPSPS